MVVAAKNVGRKKENFDRDRMELRAEPEWIARVAATAERFGLSLSAYIRQAVTKQLERDEAEQPPEQKPKRRAK